MKSWQIALLGIAGLTFSAGITAVGVSTVSGALSGDDSVEAEAPATTAETPTEAPAPATEAPITVPATETPTTKAPNCPPGGIRDTARGTERCINDGWVLTTPATTTPPVVITMPPTTTTIPVIAGPADFSISLFETGRECFGSAGALVTFEPDLAVNNPAVLGNDYLVIYQVDGGEDGSETLNMEITADGKYSYRGDTIGTATCDGQLTATITAVRER